jgi:hypothetical protein
MYILGCHQRESLIQNSPFFRYKRITELALTRESAKKIHLSLCVCRISMPLGGSVYEIETIQFTNSRVLFVACAFPVLGDRSPQGERQRRKLKMGHFACYASPDRI